MILIDGKSLAEKIRDEVKNDVSSLPAPPKLGVLLVGDDKASSLYVNLKEKAAQEAGIRTDIRRLPAETVDKELISVINEWNEDRETNAILVQLPLPPGHDTDKVVSAMDPEKDADGFHHENVEALVSGNGQIISPVHEAVLRCIASTGLDPRGKAATVIANSDTFADPLIHLLKHAGFITAWYVPDGMDTEALKTSDVVVIAIGRARFLGPDLVKPGSVIIDVGTNKDELGKTCGDADTAAFTNIDGWITPVPGGVGPMTVALLLNNVVRLYGMQHP
jgi:methylenetetrahydrofolate dehydrogenase (NADP+) / methenyltetrahydrofolate cyclohydrolase